MSKQAPDIILDWWGTYKRNAELHEWADLSFTSLREDLEDIPDYPVPDGYRIRYYKPGDEEDFARIWNTSGLKGWDGASVKTFFNDYGTDPKVHKRRCIFAETLDGKVVGTVTAWHTRYKGKRWGMVHWFAVDPAHGRKGLGKSLMSECLRCMKKVGHRRAMVGTQTVRLPAIKTYVAVGFIPELPEMRRKLSKYIDNPALKK